ncbi:divalent-cation tolerance protein CutA [Candidatus Poseidoniaceae archaeon]|nr:divalent-cation tolerance protein CutA [Candidatus Poseidoniaceae archaeon]|tara:strand:- start:1215 stop:1553 length:339 start_codon:yes stop_codon:yes gene_type:complete
MTHSVYLIQTTLPGSLFEAIVGEFKCNLLRSGAACVEHQTISSMYVWKGEVQSEPEWKILASVSEPFLPQVLAAIEELHPYETPQILHWKVGSSSKYSKWANTSGSASLGKA